jgi:Ion channel
MGVVLAVASVAVILLVLLDGFESMILPRRVSRPFRLTRIYYLSLWGVWRGIARAFPPSKRRESFLSMFGPLSMLGLFATWVVLLIVAFGTLHWSLESSLLTPATEVRTDYPTYQYLSGVTFFTLGYGDVTARADLGRALTVVEAGVGFGFMAVIIGYMPVIYQAFSRRELTISLLDARAGSPPSAAELLLRLANSRHVNTVDTLLAEWERWSAMVLESHLSYPSLSFYRSQHDNQSWLAALTMILDTCSFLIAGVDGADPYQAQLTFAMARHTAVDLALVFQTPPRPPAADRLPPERLNELRVRLRAAGLVLAEGEAVDAKLAELRELYEPFVNALAHALLYRLPPIVPDRPPVDNWQSTAWTGRAPGIGKLLKHRGLDEHFD